MPEYRFISNHEVRIVPAGWQHPVDKRVRYAPLFADQMPEPNGETEIVAYETTSEGTPISPAFPTTPEGRLDLVRYCSEHCTTFGDHLAGEEAWAVILFGEGAVVTDDGTIQLS